MIVSALTSPFTVSGMVDVDCGEAGSLIRRDRTELLAVFNRCRDGEKAELL
jgi:hypothetical protein